MLFSSERIKERVWKDERWRNDEEKLGTHITITELNTINDPESWVEAYSLTKNKSNISTINQADSQNEVIAIIIQSWHYLKAG